MSRLLTPAFLAAALAAPALPASAEPQVCAERTKIAEKLASGYSEQLVGAGVQSADGLIEVWSTVTGATWTILMTRPDGVSCVVATGTDWHRRDPVAMPAGTSG